MGQGTMNVRLWGGPLAGSIPLEAQRITADRLDIVLVNVETDLAIELASGHYQRIEPRDGEVACFNWKVDRTPTGVLGSALTTNVGKVDP